jgi:Mannosyltransferase (PIG-V)
MPRPSPEQWRAARVSLLAVFWTRLLVWESSIAAIRLFRVAPSGAFDPTDLRRTGYSLGTLLTSPVLRWDGMWYLTIARHGYAVSSGLSPPPRANFFPLYPLIVGGLGHVGVPLVLGAVLVSLGCLWIALYALMRLMDAEFASGQRWASPAAARLTVIALAVSPVAFFLSSAYPESLVLALSVGAFLYARQGRWARAGLLAGLGSAARGPNVILIVPLLALYLYGPRTDQPPDRERRGWHPRYRLRPDVAWLALAPTGLLAFALYLGLAGASPLAFAQTQHDYWGHVARLPWTTLVDAVRFEWWDLREIVGGAGGATLFGISPADAVSTRLQNLLPLASLAIAVPAVIGVWRRLPAAYGLYVTAAILVNLMSPTTIDQPLRGMSRYLTVLFPLFMWFGGWLAERPKLRIVAFGLSAALLALLAAQFATWHYVS